MEDQKTSTLTSELELDGNPLINQFMYIEELNNADGSFILSTLIKHQIGINQNIIFVVCHHSVGHFHSISRKLGYDLFSLKEEVYVIDILDKIISDDFLLSSEALKKLYIEIKEQLNVWGDEKGVCIIVENLGNLNLTDSKDLLTFIGYLRALALNRKNSSCVLSLHTFSECSNFSFITKSIRHIADVIVQLRDLQTGRANDVTGHLTLIRKEENYQKITLEYQYQLQDRAIRVFPPGSNFI